MKKVLLGLTVAFSLTVVHIPTIAQGTWTQKAYFGGIARTAATGFSIGNKGYIGTGISGNFPNFTYYNDFWEWNKLTNVWTQKASMSGFGRQRAVGFSIGTKGYIGTGYLNPSNQQDFWEWDQTTNTWTQKANFGGTARDGAVGFSIGTKGYIGSGTDSDSSRTDFWEWDQAANTWTQKANFGGIARWGAVGFSIGAKGYFGTGQYWNGSGWAYLNDFWEWDQAANTWTQKANFGGAARYRAVGFSIGTKGYIGTGIGGTYQKDFWEWDQAADTWAQKANFGGWARYSAVGFSIGTKGYIGTGYSGLYEQDFWEFCMGVSPSISASSSTTFCQGNNVTLSSSSGNSYSWSTGATTSSIIVSFSGNYSVATTDANGCSTTSSGVNVTVNPLPTATISASGSTTFCQGSDVTLSSSTGNSYTWSTGATTQDITITSSGNYSVTVTNTNGCSKTSSGTNVKVNPTYLINKNVFICSGDSAFLQGNYQTTAGTYNDTLQTINGCDSIIITALSINSLPSVSISLNPDTVCINAGAYALTGGSPSGGAYSGNGVSGGNFNPSIAGIGLHNIIYTYTDGNNCSNNDTAQIYVDLCTGIQTYSNNQTISIIPNPFFTQTTLHTDNPFHNATLMVDNCFGQTVAQIKNINGQTITFNRDNLPSGLYFVRLTTPSPVGEGGGEVIAVDKLVIID